MTTQTPAALDTFKVLEAKIAAGQILLIRRESQTAAELGRDIPQCTEHELLAALADRREFSTATDYDGKRRYDLTRAAYLRAQDIGRFMIRNAAEQA
jgi:hypothetical protein